LAEPPQRTEYPLPLVNRTRVAQRHGNEVGTDYLLREERKGRRGEKHHQRRQLVRDSLDKVPVEPEQGGRVFRLVQEQTSKNDRSLLVQLELEGGDDAEVPTPAPDAPEKVGILAHA